MLGYPKCFLNQVLMAGENCSIFFAVQVLQKNLVFLFSKYLMEMNEILTKGKIS